jgi:hypothetical protein
MHSMNAHIRNECFLDERSDYSTFADALCTAFRLVVVGRMNTKHTISDQKYPHVAAHVKEQSRLEHAREAWTSSHGFLRGTPVAVAGKDRLEPGY